jgi:hypothetical protein
MNDRRDRERDRDRRDRQDRRERERVTQVRKPKSDNRWLSLLLPVVIIIPLIYMVRGGSGPSAPPEPDRLDTMNAKRITEYVTDNAIVGGALAGEKELTAMGRGSKVSYVSVKPARTYSTQGSLILTHVRSQNPHATTEAAREDAIQVAQAKLAEDLRQLDPPIRTVPSLATIREKYVRADSLTTIHPKDEDKKAWAEANLDPNSFWVEVDLEVSEANLRKLRSEGRLETLLKLLGGISLLALCSFGFLRLDGLTKGYLTWGLGLAIVTLASIAIVVLAVVV